MSFRSLLLVCYLFATSVFGQSPSQPAIPGGWIKNWLLCGPIHLQLHEDETQRGWYHNPGYETDYLLKAGGEANPRIRAGDVVDYPGGSAVWKLHQVKDSIVDLRQLLSREAPVLAYAYAEILSDKDQMMALAFGTNDGGSLWINGKKLWDHPVQRSLHVDGDWVPLALKKGRNTILFKIEQLGNRWEFCARLKPFSFSELAERAPLFRLDPLKEGGLQLASSYNDAVLEYLVQKVNIRVETMLGQPVWSGESKPPFAARIPLPHQNYQTYKVSYDVTLMSGEPLRYQEQVEAGRKREYVLFSEGKTRYSIAVDAGASASEQWAAKELQHWLREVSGVEFPVVPLDQSRAPRLVVGHNRLVQELTGTAAPADQDETYYYQNVGEDILIYGGKQRGTLYGVMSFLENEFGLRWYTPKVTVAPKRSEWSFLTLGHSESPGIRVRNDFYFEAFDPVWAARNKMNGSMNLPDQPGGVESYWSVHTFYPLVPPEEFFESHPEYYSLLNGKRVAQGAQLCLSNPDVLKIVTERIKRKMRESPEYLIYDVSQNDYYNPCECDQCQAIVKREGSESGIMIWFVNQVAEAVEKEFPDKFIGTLAYQYTRSVPRSIKPRDNVVVRFCSIECCFAHDFKTCPENKSFLDDLTGWAKRAPHLYIWDYVVNFSHYLMPYPNFGVLKSNIQTFRENNAIGIMEQAAYQSRGGEFAELRAYLLSKLLWNPDADPQVVIDDFMHGYYGRAGQYIKQYFELVQGLVKPDTHIGLGTEPVDRIYTDRFMEESLALFKKAYKVADNEDVVRRIDMAKLPVLYLKCRRTPVKARNDGTYEEFVRITEREGVTHISEAGKPAMDAFHHSIQHAK